VNRVTLVSRDRREPRVTEDLRVNPAYRADLLDRWDPRGQLDLRDPSEHAA
jgi:hypothetical protein